MVAMHHKHGIQDSDPGRNAGEGHRDNKTIWRKE